MFKRNHKPDTLILLDVDGVINSYNHKGDERGMMRVPTLSMYTVRVPVYMPSLIRHLVANNEVMWCTAWREKAATALAPVLGLPEMDVVTDGDTPGGVVSWKPLAAAPVIEAALAEGRRVIWIEDFARHRMNSGNDGVMEIDTTDDNVLLPERLPADLLEGWDWAGMTTVPPPVTDDWGLPVRKKNKVASWWDERKKNLAEGSHALAQETWDVSDDPDNPWDFDSEDGFDNWMERAERLYAEQERQEALPFEDDICKRCGGSGEVRGLGEEPDECPICFGTGSMLMRENLPDPF